MAAPLDWSAAIKLTFDEEITVDPEIVISNNPEKVARTFTSFGSEYWSADYHYDKAYDSNESTAWVTAGAAPEWIGAQFTSGKSLVKLRAKVNTNESPLQVKVQGSNNGTDYVDVASTTWDSTGGWKEITWSAVTYVYWRLYIVTKPYYVRIYELEWYEPASQYFTTGWDIYANEPSMSPEGVVAVNHFTIKKITYGDTHYEVIAWLKMNDRMKYPIGDVTVDFSGTLIGAGPSYVQPFVETFTPSNITIIFNPNDVENVEAELAVESETILVYYESYQSDDENVEVDLSVESFTYHKDHIPE